MYPDLDLSSIVPLRSEDGAVEEEIEPTQGGSSVVPEVVSITDSTPKQRDRDGDEL